MKNQEWKTYIWKSEIPRFYICLLTDGSFPSPSKIVQLLGVGLSDHCEPHHNSVFCTVSSVFIMKVSAFAFGSCCASHCFHENKTNLEEKQIQGTFFPLLWSYFKMDFSEGSCFYA